MIFSGNLDAEVVQVNLVDPEPQRRGGFSDDVPVGRRVLKERILQSSAGFLEHHKGTKKVASVTTFEGKILKLKFRRQTLIY